MPQKMNNKKGFSLVEIMIVIGIIGILATIAVPLFKTYKVRAHNAGAEALAKQINNSESALNSDIRAYGVLNTLTDLRNSPGCQNQTTIVRGHLRAFTAATATAIGCQITGTYFDASGVAFNTSGVGQTIPYQQDALTATAPDASVPPLANQIYQIITESYAGNRAFGIDSDLLDHIYFVQNDLWILSGGIDCNRPPNTADSCDFDPAGNDAGRNGGGSPTANWHILK